MLALRFITAVIFLPAAVHGKTFAIDNCVRVDVDGTVTIEAVKDAQTEFSIQLDLSNTPFTIDGTCAEGATSNSMTVHLNQSGSMVDWMVLFTTTEDGHADMDQLIKFTPSSLFDNDTLPGDLATLTDVGSTALSLTNESYLCNAEQTIPFESLTSSEYNFTVSQQIYNLHVQAFNLKGTTFSPAEECDADLKNQTTPATEPTTVPTTEPTTGPANVSESTIGPATSESTVLPNTTVEPVTTSNSPPSTTPVPAENTYVVKSGNITCIVFRGDITFSNIVYNVTGGGQKTADPIPIPTMNTTAGNVQFYGSCGTDGGPEQLVIDFYGNWTLTLTFARGSAKTSSMLAAGEDDYSLQDIQLDYTLKPELFPDVSNPNDKQTAKAQNLTDFLQGTVDGGSYKCNSKITKELDNGVKMETTNLQYKAFNTNGNENFSDSVSECPADEDSSNVVPIAVGATLGGLILIMIVAYFIGRQRRRKSGYASM